MKRLSLFSLLVVLTASAVFAGEEASKASAQKRPYTMNLVNSTQGPLWPPSEFLNKDGDFVLVGNVLTEVAPGVVGLIPGAVLVSKDTVPPLDANGKEDFSNDFGAPYQVIRELDLTPGSPDLEMELYTLSYGPYEGDFGGGPRIPGLGNSLYNLNGAEPSCPEVFPVSQEQKLNYRRPSFAVSDSPVMGFQGDGVLYNAVTGQAEDANYANGADCFPNCSGENNVDQLPEGNRYTLGRHLAARGRVRITLTDWDAEQEAYTAAIFDVNLANLHPNHVYSMWSVRTVVMVPPPLRRRPDPLGMPNVFVADEHGRARVQVKVENPFPDPALDAAMTRFQGFAVDLHSDHQIWGACPARIGPGITIHNVFNTFFAGHEVENYITVPKR